RVPEKSWLTHNTFRLNALQQCIDESFQTVYLNQENITVSLGENMAAEPFENRFAAESLASVIDAPSAEASENHNQVTHVWVSGGPLELVFDFQQEYDLIDLHFWNYFSEDFDVDNVDFTFFDGANNPVGELLGVEPQLGSNPLNTQNPIFAETTPLSFSSNIRYVRATLTGTNGEVDFNNIGFTGRLSSFNNKTDLSISKLELSENQNGISARFGNGGSLASPADTQANVYRIPAIGNKELLGAINIPSLASGEYVDLTLSGLINLQTNDQIEVIIDESGDVNECREDNNALVINLGVINNAPIVDNQSFGIAEEVSVSIELTGFDPDGDSLTYAVQTQPTNGVLSGTAPSLVYTPNAGFSGTDSFTFIANDGVLDSTVATVSISINSVNDAPVANDQSVSTNENVSIPIQLTGTDPEGEALSYVVQTQPLNGSLSGTAPNLVYTPSAGFNGSDSLTFIVNDGSLDSVAATVSITVLSVNDVPIANAQNITTFENAAVTIQLTGSDPEGSALNYDIQTVPANGNITGLAPNLIYTPSTGFVGSDSLTFIVNDGDLDSTVATVQITILEQTVDQLPDLTITEVDSESVTTDPQTMETSGSLSFTVNNQGAVTVNEALSAIAFYDENRNNQYDPGLDPVLGSLNITDEITLNTEQNYSLTVSGNLPFRDAPIHVLVDSGLVIVESIESNNIMSTADACQMNKDCQSVSPDEIGPFSPITKWEWKGGYVTHTPIVGPFIDTNNDGLVNASDIPMVIAVTRDALNVLNGDTGELVLSQSTSLLREAGSNPALADINNDGFPEILAYGTDNSVVAINNLGEEIWRSEPTTSNTLSLFISVADIDSDGQAEVLAGEYVLNNDGTTKWVGTSTSRHNSTTVAVDLDLDGQQEVLMNNKAYKANGELIWSMPDSINAFQAIGNFDEDDFPEITFVANSGNVSVYEHDGTIKWGPIKYSNGFINGGMPIIADLDNDGSVEIGVLGNNEFVVLNADGTVAWRNPASDGSTLTTAAAFDFDLDGELEVVYAGDKAFSIFNGSDGSLKFSEPHSSSTYFEGPSIVDVNGDGHANIVISNSTGIKVFQNSDNSWAPTRKIWNEHTYNISNVNDDASIPRTPEKSWLTHNSYRVNSSNLCVDEAFISASSNVFSVSEVLDFEGLDELKAASLGADAPEISIIDGFEVEVFAENVTTQQGPSQLSFNSQGDLLVALGDSGMAKIPLGSNIATRFGATNVSDSDGLIVDSQDNIIVGGSPVTKYSSDGNVIWESGCPIGNLQLLATDSEENIYVGSLGSSVCKISSDGQTLEFISGFSNPSEPVVSDDNILYLSQFGQQNIVAYSLDDMSVQQTIETPGFFATQPVYINGKLLVGKGPSATNELALIDIASGSIEVLASGFSNARARAYGPDGNLYIADAGTKKIYKVTIPKTTKRKVDLSISKLQFSQDQNSVSARFGNGGSLESEAGVQANVYRVPLIGDKTLLGSIDIPALASGEYVDLSFASPSAFQAGDTVEVVIDEGDDICECRENNNQLQITNVEPTVLGTISLNIDKNTVTNDETVSLTQQVTNSGNVPETMTVELFIEDNNGNEVTRFDNQTATDLGVNQTASFTQTWTPAGLPTGSFVIKSNLYDAANNLLSSDSKSLTVETNNTIALTVTGNAVYYLNDNVVITIQGIHSQGDSVTYELLNAPAGAAIDPSSGQIAWVPNVAQLGINPFTVRVSSADGAQSAASFDIRIESAPNQVPSINSVPSNYATVAQLYRYDVEAFDSNGDTLSYQLTSAPSGMSISVVTGEISWTPSIAQIGNNAVVVRVDDGRGAYVTQSFSVIVSEDQIPNTAPVIVSTPTSSVTAGSTYLYTVAASDTDGDTITYALRNAPSGMSINSVTGLVQWSTQSTDQGAYNVVLRATDAVGAFSEQSYVLTVTDDAVVNSPPTINSNAIGSAIFNTAYIYDVDASDSDGDTIRYALTTAPSGMQINSTSGVIEWTPTTAQAGSNTVVVRAEDGRGGSVAQSFAVFVSDGSTSNESPVINNPPSFNAKVGFVYAHQILATDADGDTLTYQLIQAPDGMSISGAGLITWTPTSEQSVNVRVRVSDGKVFVEQGWTLVVLPVDASLEVQLIVTPSIVDEDDIVTIEVTPFNAVAPVNVSLTVDGNPIILNASNQAQVTATGIGVHSVVATVSDQFGSVVESSNFSVRDPSDSDEPEANFEGLIDGQIVTAPIDIVASISDANLAEWMLAYKEKGSAPSEFVVMNSGSDNVVNEVLATFDPTLLRNGQYSLILLATDANGQEKIESVTVVVDEELKVGNFSITYEDLNVPLAGIPISVRRTYDSRDKSKDMAFGFGWSLDYQNVKVEESRTPGLGWTIKQEGTILSQLCVDPVGEPVVTVTLPDGDVERFEVAVSPRCTIGTIDPQKNIIFNAVGDTQSTLVATDNFGYYSNGNLLDDITSIGSDNYANPNNYKLTNRAGYVYDLDQNLGIRSITDPNGNVVTYTDSGIVHSEGKRVDFIRDANGRIITVTDPSGKSLNYAYDAKGDLSTVTERDGAETTFTYNSSHGLLDINDPLGRNIVRNIYDDDGRLIAQEDSEGNRTDFNHDVAGRQSVVTDRNGNITQLFYDDEGFVINQVDALGNVTAYTHDANGNELSQTNALGHQTVATFNDSNDQLTQTDALGNVTTFAYNGSGQETKITDARGNAFDNVYDANNNLVSITDPLGNVASTTVNNQGLPSSVTDVLGNSTSFVYDINGYKTQETDSEGNVMTFVNDDNGNVLSETRTRIVNGVATQETTTYEYDARDRVVKTIDALGNENQVEYNLVGNEVAQVDALGRRTEMEYDTYNRLIKTTYPDGSVSSSTYDPEGNMLTSTDRLGRVTRYTYDALNRVTSTTQADGSVTNTEYDAIGRVIANVDANGNRTVYAYDAADRRIKTTDALGNETSFAYDADGNMTSMTDANGHTTSYVYNALDQKVQTTLHDASTMLDGLDALSRKTSMTDQAGVVTNYEYDSLGRLVKVIDALGQETAYTYDSQGNKLTQVDAEGRTTAWDYDALGRVISRTLPLGQQETMAYDAVGNMISRTDFNGEASTYSYDVNNRLTQIVYERGLRETFAYDALGNRTQSNSIDNGQTTTWNYVYDALNRLVSETQFVGSGNEVNLSYVYDAQGNRTQLTETKGVLTKVTNYTFDVLNRLQTVTDPNGNITTYHYDAAGNRTGMVHANGIQTNYVYDELNRLTSLEHQDISGATANTVKRFDYELLANGKRSKVTEQNGRVTDYVYDDLYRLTSESITDAINGNHSAAYTYDSVGNRTFEVVNGVSTAYTYNDNDWLQQTGGTTYTYDDNGNTLSQTLDGVTTNYAYNAKNEMIQSNDTGASVSEDYFYNTDGIRVGKTQSGAETVYTVDSNRSYAQVLAETESGVEKVAYTYGDDLISQVRDTVINTYHYDGLGSTRALSDSSAAITDEYDYDAFGETLNQTGSTQNDYLFTGEQFDAGLDQYYLRARYYNQEIGRFTQADTWMGDN
ncbi:MAG: Ig-like domain-containing protein, partial [Arenicella sp.]